MRILATHLLAASLSLAAFAPLSACRAGESTTQPATRVINTAGAETWLERIEAKSKELKSIQADVVYDRNVALQGSQQRRKGTIQCVIGPPSKFAVHFTSLIVDDRKDEQDRWYIYDGQWLVERQDAEKIFIKRQIVSPNAKPDQADPLLSGDGPFPLPLTLEKAKTLKRFVVSEEPVAKGDPANSVHLKLVPREGIKSDFTQIDLWYDRDLLIPLRARTLNDLDEESIIELKNPRVNQAVDVKQFDVSEPKGDGWRTEVTPWEEK